MIDELNARWLAGRAASDLASAGIVVHVVDGQEAPGKPWLPDASSPVGDHFAVSIVNAAHPDVYEGGQGPKSRAPGMVLASTPAMQQRISCAYNRDAGSNNKQCGVRGGNDWCRPGCTKYWCGEDGRKWNCAYRPSQLLEAMQRQDAELPHGHVPVYGYNEVVLDAWRTPWADAVPDAILAFFRETIPREWKSFRDQVSDNFRVIAQQNFRVLAG